MPANAPVLQGAPTIELADADALEIVADVRLTEGPAAAWSVQLNGMTSAKEPPRVNRSSYGARSSRSSRAMTMSSFARRTTIGPSRMPVGATTTRPPNIDTKTSEAGRSSRP